MSPEHDNRQIAEQETRRRQSEKDQPHHTRTEVDEEIAAMEERSRRQTATVAPPPEIPPAPPRKALMIVGVALLVLLVAGAITLISHASHERALAKETERTTVPTVAVVHPSPEKHRTKNWCCPDHCWRMKNLRFTRARVDTWCSGTRTSEAA